ncbi:DUF1800 domain-containing protein [Rapidithrix thailandica]|uniref:DUF1800 domain-containing protein n=1 Tax=Rapidithrix thailandica TaxID=413964 RepID=A0AAW9SAQ7_9BACT
MKPETKTQVPYITHLAQRAGFGLSAREFARMRNWKPSKLLNFLLKDAKDFCPLEVLQQDDIRLLVQKTNNKALRNQRKKQSKEKIKELNLQWIQRMAGGQGRLREKMTLFWHNHFACRSNNAHLVQMQNNTLRKYALGNFGHLLLAVAKDPAMLQFLNNRQNRKAHPNENFARELLELFTIGRGHYSEEDIKNAARAFTGWTFDQEGKFVFRKRHHDFGKKDFMGKRGNFGGEDILQIILENRNTARFITEKIYKHFVNHVPEPEHVQSLAKAFYESEYDITRLLKAVFSADWFYDTSNRGNFIKSPVALLVGLQRHLNQTFEPEEITLFLQKVLGQLLFYPPNVGGWPEGQAWIDSSSLTLRLSLAGFFLNQRPLQVTSKEDGDMNGLKLKRKFQQARLAVNWKEITSFSSSNTSEKRLYQTSEFLLGHLPDEKTLQLLNAYVETNASSEEEKAKLMFVSFMSLPEYQLS